VTGDLTGLQKVTVWLLPIVLAVTLHEAAHGYAALLLGDRTALERGRVSLNPLRHIDPVGTVLFPAVALLLGGPIFGWAKPVPVDFGRLHHPRRDMALVALAGPATNLVLAVLSTLLLLTVGLLPEIAQEWAVDMLIGSVEINIVLAVLNMLPVPPLDGGRVAVALLPRRLAMAYARLERFGLLIVIGLFVLLPILLPPALQPYAPFQFLVAGPAEWAIGHLLTLVGAL
jgi:Zn-dependent protease